MNSRIAACSCGQLSLSVQGAPVRVSVCHCLACQRRTGAPFGQQARWARENTSALRGRASHYVRVGDNGGRARFDFCPDCGATVRYTIDGDPEMVAVPVGALADPDFPPPQRSVYGARKHAWVTLPDGIESHD